MRRGRRRIFADASAPSFGACTKPESPSLVIGLAFGRGGSAVHRVLQLIHILVNNAGIMALPEWNAPRRLGDAVCD